MVNVCYTYFYRPLFQNKQFPYFIFLINKVLFDLIDLNWHLLSRLLWQKETVPINTIFLYYDDYKYSGNEFEVCNDLCINVCANRSFFSQALHTDINI